MKYIKEYKEEDLLITKVKKANKDSRDAAIPAICVIYYLSDFGNKRIKYATLIEILKYVKFSTDASFLYSSLDGKFEYHQFISLINYLIKSDWIKVEKEKLIKKEQKYFKLTDIGISAVKKIMQSENINNDEYLTIIIDILETSNNYSLDKINSKLIINYGIRY